MCAGALKMCPVEPGKLAPFVKARADRGDEGICLGNVELLLLGSRTR